jgi:hypothetical protein
MCFGSVLQSVPPRFLAMTVYLMKFETISPAGQVIFYASKGIKCALLLSIKQLSLFLKPILTISSASQELNVVSL